jgi:hypothetical protein
VREAAEDISRGGQDCGRGVISADERRGVGLR